MARLNLALLTTTIAALAACGGSSSSSATRVTRGAITAVTSTTITVNGSVIDDSAAQVIIDGSARTKADLKPGQIVTAKVDDHSKAAEVRSHAQLRGKVDSKATSTITIGGQVVRIDDSTQFDDSARRIASVSAADRVRVSGFPDDKGGIRATRVEKDAAGTSEFEVHGVASAVSATGFTLTVSPGGATYTVTLGSGVTLPSGLANGSLVEVKAATQPTGSSLVASSVKLDDDDRLGEAQQEAEIEGIVTSGSSSSFVIDHRTITTSASTKWVGGAPGDLAVGVKVEAEGRLDASGVLAASRVSFEDSVRAQSSASNVVPAGTGGATNGTFKMFAGAITVHVSDATAFESGVANLTALAALGATQSVEVRGYPSVAGGGDIAATRIRLASGGGNAGRIFIQGPVAATNSTAKTIAILNITVNVASAQLKGRDEITLLPGDFFATVSVGTTVKARGDSAAALSGTTLTASEVELEDDK
jgi:hypothetical protein